MKYKSNPSHTPIRPTGMHSGVRTSSTSSYSLYNEEVPRADELHLGYDQNAIALKLRGGPGARFHKLSLIEEEDSGDEE